MRADPSSSLLSRLCQYYLSCLANDDAGGVSVSVRAGAAPEFADVPEFDLQGARLPVTQPMQFFLTQRVGRQTGTLRLGYPVLALSGRRDAASRTLMPLFLVDVAQDDQGLEPEWHTCSLNIEAVRELEGNGLQFAQHTVLELEAALGLSAADETPNFEELVERLKLMRPDWPWGDVSEGTADGTPAPISWENAPPAKLYERGILLRTNRPYTQGLELELQQLAQVPETELQGTALGALLLGEQAGHWLDASEEALLEVLPMNQEQRQSVERALTDPLSVITGPPGTGKSQVVANLLINCAYRGTSVLFTSKNNKAVDVVDERVNGIGRKPVLVRLGAKTHRLKLAEHLAFLTTGSVLPEELERLSHERAEFARLSDEVSMIEQTESMAIELHRQVREAAASAREYAEIASSDARPDTRKRAARIRAKSVRAVLLAARDALLETLPAGKPMWQRLTWPVWRAARTGPLRRTLDALSSALGTFAPEKPAPTGKPDLQEKAYKDWIIGAGRRVQLIESLQSLDAVLVELRKVDFSELAERRNTLQQALTATSARLWEAWVATQPAQLDEDKRMTLAKYESVLKTVTETPDPEHLPYELRREYDRLSLEAPEVVSCFSVTALSARGRLPFKRGLFDLVVFDEASQCDIASALPILFRAKRAVVIGDPQQLKHIASLRANRDAVFLAEQRLEETHAHWGYSNCSLFQVSAGRVGPAGRISLRDHHRSHPQVIGYSNRAFYDQGLRIVTRLPSLKRVRDDTPAVRWFDVDGQATRGHGGSVWNPDEVSDVVQNLRALIDRGYTGSIGVVTPFAYQAERIRRAAEEDRELWERLTRDHDFQSNTAHGFQGDERDLMIFSVVAAPGLHEGAIRFLEDESNVFNVALTRARAELAIVGNLKWCLEAPVKHLREFAQYVSRLSAGVSVPLPSSAQAQLSPAEQRLQTALAERGIKVHSGLQIEQYAVDFVYQTGETGIAIDVDDPTPEGEWGGEALEREQLKRQRLLQLGWQSLRFWPVQVEEDLPWCLEQIEERVQQLRIRQSAARSVTEPVAPPPARPPRDKARRTTSPAASSADAQPLPNEPVRTHTRARDPGNTRRPNNRRAGAARPGAAS